MTSQSSDNQDRYAPLRDIGIAPENPRAGVTDQEDDIADLAESLHPEAAGQQYPLLVRPGKGKKEQPLMALNGSRRWRAFQALVARGDITLDHLIKIDVKTTEQEIAGALVAANGHAKPNSPADDLVAIKRMLDRKMSVDKIARALNQDPADIRKQAVLASLPESAIEAFRQKRITIKTMKLLAQIADPAERQKMADMMLSQYVYEHTLSDIVKSSALGLSSNVMQVIGVDEYKARGGEVQTDLLGELPERATDKVLIATMLAERLQPIIDELAALGLNVSTSLQNSSSTPDGATSPWIYSRTSDERQAIKALEEALRLAESSYQGECQGFVFDLDRLRAVILAKMAVAEAELSPMPLRFACLHAGTDKIPVGIKFFTGTADETAWKASTRVSNAKAEVDKAAAISLTEGKTNRRISVDIAGETHVYHAAATTIATRALQTSLSTNFRTSQIVVTAQLFRSVLIPASRDGFLRFSGDRDLTRSYQSTEGIDTTLIEALHLHRENFQASGLTLIAYIADLDYDAFTTLFSQLVAFSCDVPEAKTDMLQKRARADAGEIADMLAHDVRTYYLPDAALLSKATKGKLQAYARELGIPEDDQPTKKADLAQLVAERGYQANWAPAALSFGAPDIAPIEDGTTPSNAVVGAADDGIEPLSEDEIDDSDDEVDMLEEDQLEDA